MELPALDGESKICDFECIAFEENVGWFDISVNNVFGVEVFESLKDIFDERPGFFFCECSFLFDVLIKSPFFAELGEDVAFFWGFEDIIAFDDVGVIEGEDDVNFLV